MSVSIEERSDTEFAVTLAATADSIHTTVTASGAAASAWLANILRIHRHRLSRLVVGLDAEWRPSFTSDQNPIAVLQLCVGRQCLVFQILHSDFVPDSLSDFLADPQITFVGVGIDGDVERLLEERELRVANTVDLRELAAEKMGKRELKNKGLAALAMEVMGVEIRKPKRVTMSRWDQEALMLDQIKYACVDAFISFEIGKRLFAGEF